MIGVYHRRPIAPTKHAFPVWKNNIVNLSYTAISQPPRVRIEPYQSRFIVVQAPGTIQYISDVVKSNVAGLKVVIKHLIPLLFEASLFMLLNGRITVLLSCW